MGNSHSHLNKFRTHLEKELAVHEEQKKMKVYEKQSDREQILRDAELRKQQEEQQRELDKLRRQMVGDQQKRAIDAKQRLIADEKRSQFERDQYNIQNALEKEQRTLYMEQEKKRLAREAMSQDMEASKRLKQLQQEKDREVNDMENQKNSIIAFNSQDRYKIEMQERFKHFEDKQRLAQ